MPRHCVVKLASKKFVRLMSRLAGTPSEQTGRQDLTSSNTASPLSSLTMASPAIRQERTRSAAIADEGKALGNIVAVAGVEPHALGVAARAIRRKPSCLISCSQSGRVGGALDGEGRQGPIRPPARGLRFNMVR